MKSLKYLNGVLTVIAACLVLLTLSVIGIFPKAYANQQSGPNTSIPVNRDGSINVKVTKIVDVDLLGIANLRIKTSPNSQGTEEAILPLRKQ